MPTTPIDPELLRQTARKLLAKGGALQSTDRGDEVQDDGAIAEAVGRQLSQQDSSRDTPSSEIAAGVARRASEIFARPEVPLTRADIAALQLIVRTFGRPALRFPNGLVETPNNAQGDNEAWIILLALARTKINARAAAVGALFAGPRLIGTGWRIGSDLIVTNRHVARHVAEKLDDPPDRWILNPNAGAAISFNHTHQPRSGGTFPITALAYCADEANLDFAVLRLGGTNGVPEPLPLVFDDSELEAGRRVYVIGHPLAGSTGDVALVFGEADGRKRCSPGETTARPKPDRIEHDCSTLGGNSGSCIFSADRHAGIALHFGGRGPDATQTRGLANLAIAFAGLRGHKAGEILASGVAP